MAHSKGCGFCPVVRVSLSEDVSDVIGYGIGTDDKLVGDLPVALSSTDEAQHLDFPVAQTIGITGCCNV